MIMQTPSHHSQPDSLTPLHRMWLCEAIRLHEQQHPQLEDSEAIRHARQQGSTLAQRIELRNLALAQQTGLLATLQQWRSSIQLSTLAMTLLALLIGLGLAKAAFSGQADAINVLWALLGLLGLHTLSLLGWAVSLLLKPGQLSALSQLGVWINQRLSRNPQGPQLSQALFSVLNRQRLLPWATGRALHAWWLIALCSALLSSLILLATRRYGFVLETTIVHSEFFVQWVQYLGFPAQLLGFQVPDAELIRLSGELAQLDEPTRHAWASWLMGMVVVYGILPRLVLAVVCHALWRRGVAKLRIDPADPAWAYLHASLQPTQQVLAVSDPAPEQLAQPQAIQSTGAAQTHWLASLEADEHTDWLTTLPTHIKSIGVIDGYNAQQQLLERLSQQPHTQLTLICDVQRSPDRGSLYFIAELARNTAALDIWLLNPNNDAQRLESWQHALQPLNVPFSTTPTWHTGGAVTHD